MIKTWICPECKEGKHRNCNGVAYVDDHDQCIACQCTEGPHPLRNLTEPTA